MSCGEYFIFCRYSSVFVGKRPLGREDIEWHGRVGVGGVEGWLSIERSMATLLAQAQGILHAGSGAFFCLFLWQQQQKGAK